MVVDRRLGTATPASGFYFKSSKPNTFYWRHTIPFAALAKYSKDPRVDAIYDSGTIVIYDVTHVYKH